MKELITYRRSDGSSVWLRDLARGGWSYSARDALGLEVQSGTLCDGRTAGGYLDWASELYPPLKSFGDDEGTP